MYKLSAIYRIRQFEHAAFGKPQLLKRIVATHEEKMR